VLHIVITHSFFISLILFLTVTLKYRCSINRQLHKFNTVLELRVFIHRMIMHFFTKKTNEISSCSLFQLFSSSRVQCPKELVPVSEVWSVIGLEPLMVDIMVWSSSIQSKRHQSVCRPWQVIATVVLN